MKRCNVVPPAPQPPHVCRRSRTCRCSMQALEPAPDCPIHGDGPEWPPRCETCGKFLPWRPEGKT
jgi:hypothetical protein